MHFGTTDMLISGVQDVISYVLLTHIMSFQLLTFSFPVETQNQTHKSNCLYSLLTFYSYYSKSTVSPNYQISPHYP